MLGFLELSLEYRFFFSWVFGTKIKQVNLFVFEVCIVGFPFRISYNIENAAYPSPNGVDFVGNKRWDVNIPLHRSAATVKALPQPGLSASTTGRLLNGWPAGWETGDWRVLRRTRAEPWQMCSWLLNVAAWPHTKTVSVPLGLSAVVLNRREESRFWVWNSAPAFLNLPRRLSSIRVTAEPMLAQMLVRTLLERMAVSRRTELLFLSETCDERSILSFLSAQRSSNSLFFGHYGSCDSLPAVAGVFGLVRPVFAYWFLAGDDGWASSYSSLPPADLALLQGFCRCPLDWVALYSQQFVASGVTALINHLTDFTKDSL